MDPLNGVCLSVFNITLPDVLSMMNPIVNLVILPCMDAFIERYIKGFFNSKIYPYEWIHWTVYASVNLFSTFLYVVQLPLTMKCVARYSGHLFSRLAVHMLTTDQPVGLSYHVRGTVTCLWWIQLWYSRVWMLLHWTVYVNCVQRCLVSVYDEFDCAVRDTPVYGCFVFIERYKSFWQVKSTRMNESTERCNASVNVCSTWPHVVQLPLRWNVWRDIVDTCFHASPRTCSQPTNRLGFPTMWGGQ
jgi:hypothetical protein